MNIALEIQNNMICKLFSVVRSTWRRYRPFTKRSEHSEDMVSKESDRNLDTPAESSDTDTDAIAKRQREMYTERRDDESENAGEGSKVRDEGSEDPDVASEATVSETTETVTETKGTVTADSEAVTETGTDSDSRENDRESAEGTLDSGESDSESEQNDADPESTDEEEGPDPESISTIKRLRLDPNEVIETIAYNGQEDIGQRGKAVYSLSPPFDATVVPTLKHLKDDSTESESDDEIHLRPFRFVAEGRRVVDQRPTRRLAKEELDGDDPDEATIEAWIDEAMETWKDHIRENLAPSVDIFSPHGMAIVHVEYDPETQMDEESR